MKEVKGVIVWDVFLYHPYYNKWMLIDCRKSMNFFSWIKCPVQHVQGIFCLQDQLKDSKWSGTRNQIIGGIKMSTVKLSDNVQEKKRRMERRTVDKVSSTRKLVMTAMLAAVASVLMFFSVPVPLMPSFIKLDFSELPALIAAFTLGPVSGIAVCLVKNLVNLLNTSTGGVGELCNFLLGVAFVLPAGLIYSRMRNFKGAILGSVIGCFAMAVFSVPLNYFLVYPVYTNFMPLKAIVAAYQVINPKVDNLLQALVIFNMPFTFIKGLCSVVITFLIYKSLSPIIKGFR